jgi:iron complex outermembrane receptor protein
VFLQAVGNDDFQAERLIGYEAGYRTLLSPRVFVDVAAFHNEHGRLSSFTRGATLVEQTPPPLRAIVQIPYVNEVSGTSDGVEVSSEFRTTSRWQVRGAYSFVSFDLGIVPDSIDVNAVARYEGSSPHHQVRIQPQLSLAHGIEIDGTYRFVSALPAREVPAYHTADLRLGWTAPSGLELFLSGQNLLQPHHLEFAHVPAPSVGVSRSFYLGFTWTPSVRRP